MFDAYCEWKNAWQTEENETMMKVSLFNSNPDEYDKDYADNFQTEDGNWVNLYDVNEYPWNVKNIYQGIDLSQYTYDFGYGKLSAGHLDFSKNAKNFGTLGQSERSENV